VLAVHGDRVYIFRANGGSYGFGHAEQLFNSIVFNSVQWE
jgi:hypothetical protein